jgi:hypothetical protein
LSYGFLVPPISFGAFSLRNILLRAGLMLPFGDEPLRFMFGISSFAVPFELTVMCFGGRGYLRVEIDTAGGRTLEGALEFGGGLAFDVGVASGGVYVMAGVYFKITRAQTSLAGYLRAGGNLNVLGLIHVNVEFLLMVTYRDADGDSELYGTATLTISIELFFFSIDVAVTMEMRIAGSKRGDGGSQASLPATPRGPLRAWEPGPSALVMAAPRAGVGAAAADDPPRCRSRRGNVDRTYFQRSDIKPSSGDEPPKGRFGWDDARPAASAAKWVADYWSQFDLAQP